jgi:RhtB (resistance to homoserine/threonine) family protein
MISDLVNIEQFISVVLIHFFAVISPGPDFVVVSSQSIKYGRKSGFITSLGIGFGILIHVSYCILGIGYIVKQNIFLYNTLKIFGAIYICFLGISSLKNSSNSIKDNSNSKISKLFKNPFTIGFLTNVFNPKATLFFISLFALVINPETPFLIQLIYGFWMVLVTSLWFCLVSYLISSYYLKIFINKYSVLINQVLGVVLIVISFKIIFT